MHRCLETLEILHAIYKELEAGSAFDLALTCKAFLEPGLDRTWYEVCSFEPFISSLPDDLLAVTTIQTPGNWSYDGYSLRRDLERVDLHRYLTYYAPRIRCFELELDRPIDMKVLSIQVLQSVQLVTEGVLGVLSPHIQRFVWFSPKTASYYFNNPNFPQQVSAHMGLFLGQGITSMQLDLRANDSAVHRTAARMALHRLGPTITKLEIRGIELLKYPAQRLPWYRLQHLSIVRVTVETIPLLATLPRLETLFLEKMEGIENDDAESNLKFTREVLPAGRYFPNLKRLEGESCRFGDVGYILRYLPATNCLEAIRWKQLCTPQRADMESFVQLIARHCNPASFSSMKLEGSDPPAYKRPDDGDNTEPAQLDLNLLSHFQSLEQVDFKCFPGLEVGPEFLAAIPHSWPKLKTLVLCPSIVNSSLPLLIDHTHVTQLVRQLPHLQALGLRFDTTKITAEECEQTEFETPTHKLHTLRLGNSPIESRTRVIAFLKANFPALEVLDRELAPTGSGWRTVRVDLMKYW